MKGVGLAAAVLVGISYAATSSIAAALVSQRTHESSNAVASSFADLVEASSKNSKQSGDRKKRKRHRDDLNFSYRELGIIPGHVPTPYGYRDCMGRWHLHDSGIIHCHGQLIGDD